MTTLRQLFAFVLMGLSAAITVAQPADELYDPSNITYLGKFQLPGHDASDPNCQRWSYGRIGLTYMEDCMGFTDPTPNDGYPGCLGGFGNSGGLVAEYCNIAGTGCCSPTGTCPADDPLTPLVDENLEAKQACDGCAGTTEEPWLGRWANVTRACFGIIDIPGPDGQAQRVSPVRWDIGDNADLAYNEAADNWDEADGASADDGWHLTALNPNGPIANCTEKPEKSCFGGNSDYFAVYYDTSTIAGEGNCRLWYSYGDWYASGSSDDPWLWISDCDIDNPNPRGAWDFGPESDVNVLDPNHTLKQYRIITDIPQRAADYYFGGNTFLFGGHRKSGGGNGSSAGPTFHVRPWQIPEVDVDGKVNDHTPVMWYRWWGSYWWQARDFNFDINTDAATWGPARWDIKADQEWGQYVSVEQNGGIADAYVVFWGRPTVNLSNYPHNQTPPFEYDGTNPDFPPYQEWPVCWYGYSDCKPKDTFAWANAPTYRETLKDQNTKLQFSGIRWNLRLDGTDDSVSWGDNHDKTGAADFTAEALVRTAGSISSDTWIFGKKTSTGTSDAGWALYINSSGNASAIISDGSSQAASTYTTSGVDDGEWHRVSLVFNATAETIQLYVDGNAAATDSTTGFSSTSSSGVNLTAGSDGGGTADLEGDLIDFRMWTAARSSGDINGDLWDYLTGAESNLSGYWPCDGNPSGACDGILTTLPDNVAAVDGTVSGAIWNGSGPGGYQECRDCNTDDWGNCPISWDSGTTKGWHCNDTQAMLLFYDPAELAKSYNGEIEAWEVQPYTEVYASWWPRAMSPGIQSNSSAYDRERQLNYFAMPMALGYVHIIDFGEGGQPPEDPCGDGYCDVAGGEDYENCPADCPPPSGLGVSRLAGGAPGGKIE